MLMIPVACFCYMVALLVAPVLLQALLSMGAAPNPSAPPAIVFVIIFSLCGILGTILLVAFVKTQRHLYFCIAGFLYQHGKKIDVYRWEEMEVVWDWYETFIGRYVERTYHCFALQMSNGKQIDFTDVLSDRLTSERLSQQLVRCHWSQAMQAYEGGHMLVFGKVGLNKQGISNGQELLPWDQVQGVTRDQKTLQVWRGGMPTPWLMARVEEIPNVAVFFAVVDTIQRGQRGESR